MAATGRHGARRLLIQALYQLQVGGHDKDELVDQFSARKEFDSIDREYFLTLLDEIINSVEDLDAQISAAADRPVAHLDPVERSVIWLGLAELGNHPDIPVGVVLNEAIELSKQFGAQNGYRYVNAVLDKAADTLRK